MKKNKTIITNTAIFLALALPVYWMVSGSIPIFAQKDPKTDVKQAIDKNGVEVAGTIVVTKKPKQVLDYAKNNNLKPNFAEKTNEPKKIIALDELPNDPKIKKMEKDLNVDTKPDYVYRAFFTPNDPKYSDQWNLSKVKAPKAWDVNRGDSSVTVAVIDTGTLFSQTINGTTYSQPDFPSARQWENPGETGNTQAGDDCWTGLPENKKTNECDDDDNGQIDDWRGWDFMGGFRGSGAGCPNNSDPDTYESPSDSTFVMQDNDPQPYSCDSVSSPSILNKNHYDGRCIAWESACYVGHGTMVASVIGAATNNSKLIAGIDHNAKIMNVRVLDGYGYTTSARIASGINYAADNGADVINMSLGMSCDNESFTDSVMETALDNAKSAGVVSVAASGNDGNNTICYPASSSSVMAIGATDENDKRISYSSWSKNGKLDVVAPSEVPVANAPSAFINSNYYGSAGGTSLSTPHVAGLAALIAANWPDFSMSEIKKLIIAGTDRVADMKGKIFHKQYGYGRINLERALSLDLNFGKDLRGALSGDWNGDGKDTIGIKRGNFYLLDNNNDGEIDIVFAYGTPGSQAVVGDWDGDGDDTISVKIGNKYYINNDLAPGTDAIYSYGRSVDTPITGDWNGNGRDTVSVKIGDRYFINNQLAAGTDLIYSYGSNGSLPLSGDWDGDGDDTISVKIGNKYYINNDLAPGTDYAFTFD